MAHKQKTIRQEFTQKALGLLAIVAVGMPLSIGLGYANELGLQREAEGLKERLTDDQRAFIETAIEQDKCSMFRPKISGLCSRVKNGDMTLTP